MHTRAAVAVFDAGANNKIATGKVRSDRNMSRALPIATIYRYDPACLAPLFHRFFGFGSRWRSNELIAKWFTVLSCTTRAPCWRMKVASSGRPRLKPLPDQEPAALILIQANLLDGNRLSYHAIERFEPRRDMDRGCGDGGASQLGCRGFLLLRPRLRIRPPMVPAPRDPAEAGL